VVMCLVGPGPGQVDQRGKLNYGPCDPTAVENPYGLTPFREDTVLFTVTQSAAGGAIAAGTSILAYTKGDDQEDTDGGWPAGVKKTSAEVLAYNDGALAEETTENFVVEGMALEIERPFILLAPAEGAALHAAYPAWLDEYDNRLRESFMKRLSVEYVHGTSDCKWKLGKPARWPTNGGPTGPIVSNGGNAAIGMYMPLAAKDYAGPKDQKNKLKVRMKVGALGLFFPNTTNLTWTQDVKVPIAVTLYGRRKCKGGEVVMAPEGVPQALVQKALQDLISRMSPAEVAAALDAFRNKNGNGG
jgi:hypothetical protein